MDPLYAPVLENWYPHYGELELRGGSASYATMASADVKSLFQYSPTSGTRKLLAATNAGIYDVTAGGAAGDAIATLTNGYVCPINITNSAGTSFLWICNGTDKVQLYDGSTWKVLDGSSTPAITGITTTDIAWATLFKHRLFLIKKNSFDFYFLPLDSIAGAAAQFPVGNLFPRGGYLMSATSWTLDSGDGPDDLLVMISSEGELVIYQGIDPTSAASWSIVGHWYVGRPMGRRCFSQFGADVCALTETGVWPLSKLLESGTVNFAQSFSNKISPTYTGAARTGFSTAGWESLLFPPMDALLVNVPGIGQYVFNTAMQAWCAFKGWKALCFTYFAGKLYFGTTGGVVMKAWDGILTSDSGIDIVSTCHQAWNYFGDPDQLKTIATLRMQLAHDGPVEVKLGVSPDFTPAKLSSYYPRTSSNPGTPWETSSWETSSWAPDVTREKLWRGAAHRPGYALALWLQTASNASTLSWSGTDNIIARGGPI